MLTINKTYNDVINSMFDTFNHTSNFKKKYDYSNVNYELIDDDNTLKLSFDVPGFSKSDITIEVKNLDMVISGNVDGRTLNKKFKLSDSWDLSKSKAKVKNGVLDITIPKIVEKQGVKIEIK